MKMHPSIDLDTLLEVAMEDGTTGFCVECGAEAYGVEPDAEKYRCEACGAHAVYGAEQLIIYMA